MRRFSPKIQKTDSFLVEEHCRCWSWELIRLLLSNPERRMKSEKEATSSRDYSWKMRFEKVFHFLGLI